MEGTLADQGAPADHSKISARGTDCDQLERLNSVGGADPPIVDTAVEDKIKDRQKAMLLQATPLIHTCRKESLFFLQTNWTKS